MWRLSLAISFLTILPVRLKRELESGDLGRAGAWFSWVGLLIGAILCAGWLGFHQIFPSLLASTFLVAGWAALTGGLHLDGLADCGDGLLNPSSPERRLEIMKDPRLGSFGGITLILFLLLKISAVGSLSPDHLWTGIFLPLTLAPVTGRWLILLAARQPAARPSGLGAEFKAGLNSKSWIVAAIPPILLALLGGWISVAALIAAHLVAFALFMAARRLLGGLTGDVFGLTIEISELVILLAFSLRLP